METGNSSSLESLTGRRVTVTGGAGFIGSNLVRRLIEMGSDVTVLDNFSTGRAENLAGLRGVDIIRGSILDAGALEGAVAGRDVVFHLAAIPSVARSVADPLASHEINATGTLRVLDAARRLDAGRVVFASSSSVYGETPTLPKRETMTPAPISPYGVAKLAGEHYCAAFHRLYGLETVALRYFNVYGPRQDPQSEYAAVVPRFISRCMRGEPPVVFGDGRQTRDFTFVEDTVGGTVLSGTAKGAPGHVFNIACGERIAVNRLAEEVITLTNTPQSKIQNPKSKIQNPKSKIQNPKSMQPIHAPSRAGDIRHSLADISLARKLLGYRPEWELRDGLRRTVEWLRTLPL